jgi:hypothetical protein
MRHVRVSGRDLVFHNNWCWSKNGGKVFRPVKSLQQEEEMALDYGLGERGAGATKPGSFLR